MRRKVTAETLGHVADSYSNATKFHGVFIQIAHEGQQPASSEPAFRILRFADSLRDKTKSKRTLEKTLVGTGNILYQERNQTTLICKDLERQCSAHHILPLTQQLKQDYLDYVKFRDDDFVANRADRKAGRQEEAKKRQDAYIDKYNQFGWVKYMRKLHKIHPDIKIVPGMHTEAETETKELRRIEIEKAAEAAAEKDASTEEAGGESVSPAAAAAAPAPAAEEEEELSSEEEEEEEDGIEGSPYPAKAKRSSQKFASISFLVDESDDMEVLIYLHGVYGSMEEAREHVTNELTDSIYPLQIHVVDMYEWIFPLQMLWENSEASKRVEGLEETNARMDVQMTNKERAEAVQSTRRLKDDVKRRKKMNEEVVKGLCAELGLTPAQLDTIMDNPAFGREPVMALCKIADEAERKEKALALLEEASK